MTDTEFFILINSILKHESLGTSTCTPVINLDDPIDGSNLDSFGMLMFLVWISELFGITDEHVSEFIDAGKYTVLDLKEFISKSNTRVYSYQNALDILHKEDIFK